MNRHLDFLSQRLADPTGGSPSEIGARYSNDHLGAGRRSSVTAAVRRAVEDFRAGSGGPRKNT
ncbi:hypothetical protein ACFVVX_25295 [Kitasatospora sp. NPDC058170]|uniref:hypothetical protein n=1 Tax=Kitasatospora sp. NPDC058170 TaxID=3346364 RepID=UPI0036D794D8